MRFFKLKRLFTFFVLSLMILSLTACDDDFYLSENETAAYQSIFASELILNQHFDNLQGRTIDLTFDNSTGTPRLMGTNLLTEMRRTELANLEQGPAAVSLDRLRGELENQIGKWVENKLALYTNAASGDRVRLTELSDVSVTFLNNPTFIFQPEKQTIAYDMHLQLVINGEIEVNAVNWLINIFTGINGTYPLRVTLPDLRLNGEANIYSPYVNGGRIGFEMVPKLYAPVDVRSNGTSVPNAVKEGVARVLTRNLSVSVDEVFVQEYDQFAFSQIRLTPETAQFPSRLEVSYRSKADPLSPDAAPSQMHIVARATDGKLYHARKSNGDWTDYLQIPLPNLGASPYPKIEADPALFHSGNDQLELAATNQNGDLIYSHWRDGAWGNGAVFNPGANNEGLSFRGKPAIVASAPGQAEIIVAGGDGNLWHLRRKNGLWPNPAIVPISGFGFTRSFRDPVAAHVGNKIVVVFADAQDRPAAIAFDLETERWGQPTLVSGGHLSRYAPAAVAGGEDRLDVVYVDSAGSIFHRLLRISAANFNSGFAVTGISLIGNEENIEGKTDASPVLTCSSHQQPELFVRGLDGHLYHNHFVYALGSYAVDGRTVNPGWQGWTALNGFLFAPKPVTDGRVEEFAAAGTRTGNTEVAARGVPKYGSSEQIIFHNRFESGRYGRAVFPWKTVGWRGWEASSSSRKFVGRPAIAAVDRNFQLAQIGNRDGFGSTLHTERLAETNQTYFLGYTSPVSLATPVNDPLVLSTGPGTFDTFTMLSNGRPEHIRHYDNGSSRSKTLPVPPGVTIGEMSATAYGNGFVDLAASASDKRIYFWRYRGGVWSSPVALGDQIISAPILKHTGDGQLELLAIDFDHKLFRWQFTGNAWRTPLGFVQTFPIDNLKFSPLSASSWGDGTVDLVVADLNSGQIHHRRIGPGVWTCTQPIGCPPPRAFQSIGGTAWEAPVLTAFSPTKLNVLTMQGLRWYSSWADKAIFQPYPAPRDPVIKWGGLKYIGGDEMVVGGAAHSGRDNFSAIAVRDGEYYINRNENGRWTDFRPIVGQRPDQIHRLPIFLPAIASHSE
ncbi:MAG: hypothetical protein R2747_00705 [Pyrinomonadaceae bacterium]